MAPGYRAGTRRSGRGNVDHDVYEGLPVRQWRRDTVHVAPPPAQDGPDNVQDKWDVELPWGMPKDSNLLSQHAQDLLRAARSGRIYKRSLPVEEENDDADGMVGDKPDKKEDTHKDSGFAARAWKQVPRHMEGPDVEYLAKRRKGLQAINASGGTAAVTTMTRMTVRRTDAAGNVYQEVIVVPQGQAVDGEIVEQVPVVDPSAAVPVNAGLAQPARIISRKPPPPKGKKKGPGRGRKKKILAPTSAPGPSPQLPTTETAVGEHQTSVPAKRPEGLKPQLKTENSINEDTEMGEYSQHNSDDDGDDGEEGEEGEIVESDDEHDGSADGHGEMSTPTPGAEPKGQSSRAAKSVPGGSNSRGAHAPSLNEDTRSTPDFSAVKAASAIGKDEGSPLKTVQIIKDEPQPDVSTAQQPNQEPISAPVATKAESQQPIPPISVSSEQTIEVAAEQAMSSTEQSKQQETEQVDDPDEMLLDTIESSNLPTEAGDGREGGEGGDGQRSREDSEFPDLMGSLERHLDGTRSGGGGGG